MLVLLFRTQSLSFLRLLLQSPSRTGLGLCWFGVAGPLPFRLQTASGLWWFGLAGALRLLLVSMC